MLLRYADDGSTWSKLRCANVRVLMGGMIQVEMIQVEMVRVARKGQKQSNTKSKSEDG